MLLVHKQQKQHNLSTSIPTLKENTTHISDATDVTLD